VLGRACENFTTFHLFCLMSVWARQTFVPLCFILSPPSLNFVSSTNNVGVSFVYQWDLGLLSWA
jgi:hypothetical protein